MANVTKQAILKDPKLNMSAEARNSYLGAKLTTGTNATREITKIERYKTDVATGWRIFYLEEAG